MNKHDKRRLDAVTKTLQKAKEQAETARLYLTVNDRDPEQIADMALVQEHIDIALGHLGKKGEETI